MDNLHQGRVARCKPGIVSNSTAGSGLSPSNTTLNGGASNFTGPRLNRQNGTVVTNETTFSREMTTGDVQVQASGYWLPTLAPLGSVR
jgi:hypothetical protein